MSLWLWSIMDCIFATKPPLFTPQCEVEANWNWFCLSTQTHSFHTERPGAGALKHESGHFSTWTLFSHLYPSYRSILTKISSIALLWSYLHLVCLGAVFQRSPKQPVDSKYSQKPTKSCPFSTLLLLSNYFLAHVVKVIKMIWRQRFFKQLWFRYGLVLYHFFSFLLGNCSCYAHMLPCEVPQK